MSRPRTGWRQRLRDLLAERERVAEHPGRVFDPGLRLDGAVGDDLRDPLFAVFLGRVTDHVAAAALIEVEVDVGHRDALGVEEPLEDEAVYQRVEFGDAERVGDDRAGRRTPARADPDALAAGVGTEVGDDEEVAREPHLADHVEFVLGLAAVRVGHAIRDNAAPDRCAPAPAATTPRSGPAGTGKDGIRSRWAKTAE